GERPRALGERARETDRGPSKRVDPRRRRARISVAAEVVRAERVDEIDDDVRSRAEGATRDGGGRTAAGDRCPPDEDTPAPTARGRLGPEAERHRLPGEPAEIDL